MKELICGYTTIWQCAFEGFGVALLLLLVAAIAIGLAFDWIKGKVKSLFR